MILNRISKLNWRYASGEILLIFVGITLAIGFDEWRQYQADIALERELLLEVLVDLRETKTDLEDDIASIADSSRSLVRLVYAIQEGVAHDEVGPDLRTQLGGGRLYPKASGYRALQDAGLVIIRDPGLRSRITNFFELRLSRIASVELFAEKSHEEFRHSLRDYLKPFTTITDPGLDPLEIRAQRQIDIEAENIDVMLVDSRLLFLMLENLLFRLLVAENYGEGLKELESLSNEIEQYLAAG